MSVDMMRPNHYRRARDWERIARSYHDDLCAVIAAGNELRRRLRAIRRWPEVATAIGSWDDSVRAAIEHGGGEPICVLHSTSPGEGVPAPEQTGALTSVGGPSAPGLPTPDATAYDEDSNDYHED